MSYVRSGSARRVASWVQSTSSAGKTTVNLELDAKVELIRSLVPLGLMHRRRDARRRSDGVGRCPVCPQGRLDRGPSSRQQSGDGGPRGAARANSCPPGFVVSRGARFRCGPTAALHGEGAVNDRLLTRVLYGISCRNYAAAAGGDSRGDRAVGVDRVPDVSSRPVPRNCTSSTSETSPMRTWWPSSWTARRSPRRRW